MLLEGGIKGWRTDGFRAEVVGLLEENAGGDVNTDNPSECEKIVQRAYKDRYLANCFAGP